MAYIVMAYVVMEFSVCLSALRISMCTGVCVEACRDFFLATLSTGTPIPAQWTCHRRCRDRADIEHHPFAFRSMPTADVGAPVSI